MTPFINFTELYSAGGSFDRQEVVEGSGTSTVYGGYAPSAEPTPETAAKGGWLIRRLVVTESGGTQTIECTWARGSWDARASLEYKYMKP